MWYKISYVTITKINNYANKKTATKAMIRTLLNSTSENFTVFNSDLKFHRQVSKRPLNSTVNK